MKKNKKKYFFLKKTFEKTRKRAILMVSARVRQGVASPLHSDMCVLCLPMEGLRVYLWKKNKKTEAQEHESQGIDQAQM